MLRRSALALLAIIIATATIAAPRTTDAAEIELALKRLTVLGSALHIAAHPDDENTALIAYLANDRLVRAGYLSVTRGDGGQNLLGDEKGELLGVIRTQELLAARRIDGGEQYFTRAIDFGFSKNPTEALNIWGHDTILADVVWIIRKFQPDVVIARFPTTGEGGHGHHTASAILAGEAFAAAGDPTKYPEQLKYVGVWQPKRLFWNRFSFGTPIKPDDPVVANDVRIDLGAFNPLLGRSYGEIAADSRSQHKSQGFGVAQRRGTFLNYFHVLDGGQAPTPVRTGEAPVLHDLFEGIDTSWSRYPGGDAVGKYLQQAVDGFDPKAPAKSIPALLLAYDALDRLGASGAWLPNVNPWTDIKRQELLDVIRACAGIAIDVSAGDSSVVPGGDIPVSVTVINRSDYPFVLSTVATPYANPSKAPGAKLANNVPVKTDISIKLPPDFPYSQPYWLASTPTKGAFTVGDQKLIGLPENPPPIPINVTLTDATMHTLIFTVPAIYRWTDAVRGEQTRRVDVVPAVTTNIDSHVYLFPEAKPRSVAVSLHDFTGATAANVRLIAPSGWSVSPATIPIKFDKKGDETKVTFNVTPPAGASNGVARAEVELPDGTKISQSLTNIDYPHIPAQRVFGDASAKLVREDVKKRGTRVGYIMGAGDEVPDALRQIGYEVDLLTDADLERGDFAKYDAVVTGVRAYNARPSMKAAHAKLMRYVENGGTLVVQYNSLNPQPLLVDPPGPYPFKVTTDRVTVEEAPVRFVDPASPLLNAPNKITPSDFDGWVQERGLYFADSLDPKYSTVLETHDPGEPERIGGEIVTHHGKGVFIYTSYAWFRQLPAGVPGAYRLFANLVSAK
jgi:LmbE family N-acetylglucosaminyl deacetylase